MAAALNGVRTVYIFRLIKKSSYSYTWAINSALFTVLCNRRTDREKRVEKSPIIAFWTTIELHDAATETGHAIQHVRAEHDGQLFVAKNVTKTRLKNFHFAKLLILIFLFYESLVSLC